MARVLKKGRKDEAQARIEPHPFDPRAEAERILEDARAEAERLRTQAMHEGREKGLAAVTEILIGARAVAVRAQRGAEADLRVLAVRIAERILGREISLQPDAVTDIVAEALRSGGGGGPREVILRVHPDDLRALERGRPRLLARCAQAQVLHLRADPGVSRGGCIIETELGTADARLPVQLQAIERALLSSGGGDS